MTKETKAETEAVMDFIGSGDDFDKQQKELRKTTNGSKNTSKIVAFKGKGVVHRVVPLIDFNSKFDSVQRMLTVPMAKIFLDNEVFKKARENDPELEGMTSVLNFLSYHKDPDIDVAMWLREHPEAFENMRFPLSTMFDSHKKRIEIKTTAYLPCLYLSAEGSKNNDEHEVATRVFAIHQETVVGGFKAFHIEKSIKGRVFKVALDTKGTKYSVTPIDPYSGELPEFEDNLYDFIGFTTRQDIVDKLAKVGIIVPEVPEDKKHIMEKIEKGFAAMKAKFDKSDAS
jgi:hypothetical protein